MKLNIAIKNTEKVNARALLQRKYLPKQIDC